MKILKTAFISILLAAAVTAAPAQACDDEDLLDIANFFPSMA